MNHITEQLSSKGVAATVEGILSTYESVLPSEVLVTARERLESQLGAILDASSASDKSKEITGKALKQCQEQNTEILDRISGVNNMHS